VLEKYATEPGSSQAIVLRTALMDETPRYEEGFLAESEESDRALTSSDIALAISWLKFRGSLDSSGMACKCSRFPSSLDIGETCAS
jgi:hypothetical protein